MTVAVAKYQGRLIASLNGGAKSSAISKVVSEVTRRGGIFFYPNNTTHAEQAIFNVYGNNIPRIGLSNYNGPCGGERVYNCKLNVGDKGVEISWFPAKNWYK